jgi:serine/threonine-protein kinase
MIARDGSVKVLDFGIARSRGATTLTDVHKVLGTATYISPEQACGERAEERSDLYSLGCVLFAMLTGRPPFSSEDPAAVLERHLVEEPPALARAGAVGVAAGVEALLRSLLAKAPADRPADAAQVRERIASLRAGNAGAGLTRRRPARPRRATGAAAGATVPGELTPRRVWGRRRRRGRRLAGGVALASPLVVLALALALSAENRGPLPARASGAGAHRTPAAHRATSSPQVPAPAPKSGTAGGPSESARATVTDGPSKAADGPAGKHGKGHHRGHRHGGRGDGHDGKGAPDG